MSKPNKYQVSIEDIIPRKKEKISAEIVVIDDNWFELEGFDK